jgi:hypothetical protein
MDLPFPLFEWWPFDRNGVLRNHTMVACFVDRGAGKKGSQWGENSFSQSSGRTSYNYGSSLIIRPTHTHTLRDRHCSIRVYELLPAPLVLFRRSSMDLHFPFVNGNLSTGTVCAVNTRRWADCSS